MECKIPHNWQQLNRIFTNTVEICVFWSINPTNPSQPADLHALKTLYVSSACWRCLHWPPYNTAKYLKRLHIRVVDVFKHPCRWFIARQLVSTVIGRKFTSSERLVKTNHGWVLLYWPETLLCKMHIKKNFSWLSNQIYVKHIVYTYWQNENKWLAFNGTSAEKLERNNPHEPNQHE